jgi:hypothetical protein
VFGGKLDWGPEAIVRDDPNFQGRGNPSSGNYLVSFTWCNTTMGIVALGIFDTSIVCLWHLCVCTQLDFALDSMQLIVRDSDGTCV